MSLFNRREFLAASAVLPLAPALLQASSTPPRVECLYKIVQCVTDLWAEHCSDRIDWQCILEWRHGAYTLSTHPLQKPILMVCHYTKEIEHLLQIAFGEGNFRTELTAGPLPLDPHNPWTVIESKYEAAMKRFDELRRGGGPHPVWYTPIQLVCHINQDTSQYGTYRFSFSPLDHKFMTWTTGYVSEKLGGF